MSNAWLILIFLSSLISLFFFWRKLKVDYDTQTIFSCGFIIIILSLILSLFCHYFVLKTAFFARFFSPETYWFWPVTLSYLVTIIYFSRSRRIKFYELFDSAVLSLFIFMVLHLVTLFIRSFNFIYLLTSLSGVLFISVFVYLEKNYKKFTWYRSGKIGFPGLLSLGLFLILRSIFALFLPSVLSLVGLVCANCTLTGPGDALLSAVLSLIIFINLYRLSLI